MKAFRPLAIAVLAVAGAVRFAAADPDEPRAIYFHSDLPLRPSKDQTFWPQPFARDGADGVRSPFGFGDWELRPAGCSGASCLRYLRLDIGHELYAYAFDEAERRDWLSTNGPSAAIFKLEPDEASTLFAVQVGYRGGSRYILVSARPDNDGLVKTMTLLDARCLDSAGALWRRSVSQPPEPEEDYCAIDTMASLVAIAREALRRPPLATLRFLERQEERRR